MDISTVKRPSEAVNILKAAFDAPEGEPDETGIYLHIATGQSIGVNLHLESVTTEELGISAVCVKTTADAKKSIAQLKQAINKVSSNRGVMGAVQNRLERTYNSLSVMHENLTASVNRISSADMGKEMITFTKHQIVVQAAQSMLAQAKSLKVSQVQQILQF